MGAAASTAKVGTDFEKNVKKNQFDIFAQEMFSRSPKVASLNFILEKDEGKEAFLKFLKEEYAEENMWFFMVFLFELLDKLLTLN
jgi:hypothetical protein